LKNTEKIQAHAQYVPHNTAEKRLRMRGQKKDGENFKCQIVNKNMEADYSKAFSYPSFILL
jgi:hypothetical protein